MDTLSIRPSSAGPSEYLLSGQLSYDNAQHSLEAGQALLAKETSPQLSVRFSFRDVSRVDTAGIAVLLAWTRTAQSHQQRLIFCDLPAQAKALIASSGLSELLLTA